MILICEISTLCFRLADYFHVTINWGRVTFNGRSILVVSSYRCELRYSHPVEVVVHLELAVEPPGGPEVGEGRDVGDLVAVGGVGPHPALHPGHHAGPDLGHLPGDRGLDVVVLLGRGRARGEVPLQPRPD